LDLSISNGILNFDSEEGNEAQNVFIDAIIEILASDSPTDGVKRLARMMKDIYNCKRKSSEDPSAFAWRLEGLVSLYLNHCYKETAEQDTQVFAMVLLENANLSPITQDNLILQLTTSVVNTVNNTRQQMINIPRLTLTKFE